MSFFGYLAAGAAEGAGKGLADEGAYLDKANLLRETAADRASAELTRQRERDADKAALMLTLQSMKGDQGSGRGGNLNLFELAQKAKTPEEQDRLIETVRAFGGDDSANVLGRIYGKGKTRMADPAQEDVTGYVDATGGTATAVPGAVPVQASISSREAEKGRVGLNRMMAMVMDPAKLDPYSKGEAQITRNDVVGNVTLPDALKSGDRSPENMNEALSPLNPKAGLDEEKNSLAAERNRIRQQEADDKKTRGDQSLTARERKLLLDERKMAEKSAANPLTDPADAATAKERIKEIDRQIQSAPAASARSAAAPSAAASKPRSPASAAAAFKAGRSY